MKQILFGIAAVAVLALPAAGQARDTTIQLDAVVAVVGNVPITRYDVERRLLDSLQMFMQRKASMPSKAVQREMAKSALNDLVDEEVLLLRAKDLAIEVPETEISTWADQLMKEVQSRYPSGAEFRAELVKAGIGSAEEYRRMMTTQYRRNRTIEALIARLRSDNKIAPVAVPEAKVREEFDRLLKGGLRKRLASVAWRQMVIAPAASPKEKAIAKAKADSLRAEIKAGGDFERIAKRESMDAATKDLGGDLGWRRRGDLPPELERVLFGAFMMRPGDISAVIESPFGFHIIRLDRANPPAEVKARQILIIPKIDSLDVNRARLLTDSLVLVLRRGQSFDTIARHFHDLAEEAPGLIPEREIDSLPASYQQGLKDVKKDSIVAFPIPTAGGYPKFVIAQVTVTTEPGPYRYEELAPRIRFNLQQVMQARRYIDQQRKVIYVKLYEDRAMDATAVFDRPPS